MTERDRLICRMRSTGAGSTLVCAALREIGHEVTEDQVERVWNRHHDTYDWREGATPDQHHRHALNGRRYPEVRFNRPVHVSEALSAVVERLHGR